MLQLKNQSPFAPAMAVFPNKDGIDTLYVVVKGTFTLRPQLALAEKPVPPTLTDEYHGDPTSSSLKYASELHVGKAGTDVVLLGRAWAPGGRPLPESTVTVTVAGKRKVVRVVGDRIWRDDGTPTRPEPFESVPLVYERAFGGMHQPSPNGPILAEERNPVGVGFQGKRPPEEMKGQKLPNLEDPQRPIQKLGDAQTPACFGFVAPAWLPRREFAGTYDQAWQKKRAPYLPDDFDIRFFNTASPEFTFPRFLTGGEPVDVTGASRDGPLRLQLPRCQLRVTIKVDGSEETPVVNLETVVIEPDENRVCLSWRAELPCDKKVLKVEEARIEMDSLDLPGAGRA